MIDHRLVSPPLRFKAQPPRPGEKRRYVTNTDYVNGTYVITRGALGSWMAWVIQNPDDETVTTRGWLAVARGQKTMASARIACEAHRLTA